MASVELPPELLAGRAEAAADEVSTEALAVTVGLDVDVITGKMLPTFSAGTVEVEAAAAVGLGAVIGAPTGIDGSAAGAAGDGVGRDGAGGADPVDAVAEAAVTDTTPVACALVAGFVAAPAEAVRLTHAAPLDGVPIPALRVNNDGVTSVPNDPSWHESVPSPLGQKPVNVTLPADADSVTDTSGTAPFSAWTCTVKWATWPRSTLPLDG